MFSIEANIRGRMATARDDRWVENPTGVAAPRESVELFRRVFDSSAIGFAIVGLDRRVHAVNKTLCDMLGYTEAELLQTTFSAIGHPDDREISEEVTRKLVGGEIDASRLEKRYIHKDGRVVWVFATASIVRDKGGGPAYFVSQIMDLTPRKEAEAALARYSEDLERSNAELQSFAYVASHDLQQPLRTVTSYAHLLSERYQGALDERADRWIQHISSGVEQMQRLINDLLLLAQLRSNGDGFSDTDITSISRRVWDTLQQRYTTDSSLTFGDLPIVIADAAQIELLIQNLLDNAFKYRRRGVRLEVRVVAGHHTDGDRPLWQFSVRDNGIGFDMVNSERVFELFTRLHSADEYEGTGIGLTICKRIVERHHGRIWVESAPGNGSTFFFTLPEGQT